VERERARALDRAVEEAGPEDVVLVCGKGHEREQIVGGTRRPFDDAEVARSAHGKRRPPRPVL
jgi:UDP-N-acetylmuramoyl-L-alanyl-D-glutamate--2,6-diaminopimelate ligase